MQNVFNIFKQHYGYAYLKDLKVQGIYTDTIRQLLSEGKIEKIKPGLYKLADFPMSTYQASMDACMAIPKAVFDFILHFPIMN